MELKLLLPFSIFLILTFSFTLCKSEIIEINMTNYNDTLDANNLIGIFIYSDTEGDITDYENGLYPCKKCQPYYQVYEQFVENYYQQFNNTPKICFGKLKIQKNEPILQELEIRDIPSFVFFNIEREIFSIYEYKKFTVESLRNFVQSQIDTHSQEIKFKTLNNIKDLLKLLKTEKELNNNSPSEISEHIYNKFFIFIGDSNLFQNEYNNFLNAATNLNIPNIFHSVDPDMYIFFSVSPNSFDIVVYDSDLSKFNIDKYEKMYLESENTKNHNKLEILMFMFTSDIIQEYSPVYEQSILEGVPSIIFLDYKSELKKYKDGLKKLATFYRRDLRFFYADENSDFIPAFKGNFNLTLEDFPLICITSLASYELEVVDKFRISFKNEKYNLTMENIHQKLTQWKEGKLERFYFSEAEQKNPYNIHGVMKLVRSSIIKILQENDEKDYFVFICSSRFEICKQSKERFIRLSNKVKLSRNLVLAELNPYLNEVTFLKINQVPSFFLFPGKNKIYGISAFQGKVTTANLLKFLKKHSTHPGEIAEEKLENEEQIYKEEEMNPIIQLNSNQEEDLEILSDQDSEIEEEFEDQIIPENVKKLEKIEDL